MEAQLNGVTLQVISGDITELAVDGIVITATPQLDLKTGLGKLVLQKGGPQIWDALDALPRPEVGQAVITPAGTLPSRYIIHAVGPMIGTGEERGKLSSVIWNTLRLADQNRLSSLAFSAISTGRFGFPIEGCANVMSHKIVDFTFEDLKSLSKIIVCLEDSPKQQIFEKAFRSQIDNARNDAGASS
jgi:O-acetyl-ADP-ribose deacetylase (regulator of RNase III)